MCRKPSPGPPVRDAGTHAPVPETVVLLHGLGRTFRSMAPLENRLQSAGYRVINVDYPSRDYPIDQLARWVDDHLARTDPAPSGARHFVTHSLGGILVRWLRRNGRLPDLGRVVMLSPPNQGSQIVDRLMAIPMIQAALGPAFTQLGTGAGSVPVSLGPVDFDLGVIIGDVSLNPLFSLWLPGDDDGKVSLDSARVEGMTDYLVVPHSHGFMMNDPGVMNEVVFFLENGRFERP